jgi:hypothetical protein
MKGFLYVYGTRVYLLEMFILKQNHCSCKNTY